MSVKKEAEKKFLIEVLGVYQTLPALWRIKSDDYSNRAKKAEAYDILLQKYREHFTSATLEDLKKKINNLRTNFRNELRKMDKSAKSGAGTEDLYESRAWFMEAMMFLRDQETPAESRSTLSNSDDKDTSDKQGTIQVTAMPNQQLAVPPSAFNNCICSFLRFLLMIKREAQWVLLQVYIWGTLDKNPNMNLHQYLQHEMKYSRETLRSHLTRDDFICILNKSSPADFDISLLCNLIPLACKYLNRPDGRAWVFGELEDSIRRNVMQIKNLRNSVFHGPIQMKFQEFSEKVEELKNCLLAVLQSAQDLYRIDQQEVDRIEKNLNQSINRTRDERFEHWDITNYENHILLRDRIAVIQKSGKLEIKEKLKYSYLKQYNIPLEVSTIFSLVSVQVSSPSAQQKFIKYQDVIDYALNVSNGSTSTECDLILIESIDGVSNTIFTKHVISEWVAGHRSMSHLLSYDLLIYMECKNPFIKSFDHLLNSMMPRTHMQFQDGDFLKCTVYLKLLVIVDGFDELNSSSKKVFKEILGSKLTNDVTIVCTSQPGGVGDFYCLVPKNQHVCHFRLNGVPPSQRIAFAARCHEEMRRTGQSTQDTSELENFLEESDVYLQEHWRFPKNLDHLTKLWADKPNQVLKVSKATEFFLEDDKMIRGNLLRRISNSTEGTQHYKLSKLKDKVEKVLLWVYKEALTSLTSNHINVLPDDSAGRIRSACESVDLPEDKVFSAYFFEEVTRLDNETKSKFTFGPNRKQEFLGANYVIQVLLGNQLIYDTSGITSRIKSHPSFVEPSLRKCFVQKLMACVVPCQVSPQSSSSLNLHPSSSSTSGSKRGCLVECQNHLGTLGEGSLSEQQIVSEYQTISNILEMFNIDTSDSQQLKQYQSLLVEIAGLIYQLPDQIRKQVASEIVNLLQKSGVTNRDQWLDLIHEMKCCEDILQCIIDCDPNLIIGYAEIRDSRVKAYAQPLSSGYPEYIDVIIKNDPRKVLQLELYLQDISNNNPDEVNLGHQFRNGSPCSTGLDFAAHILFKSSNVGVFCGWMSRTTATILQSSITELCIVVDENNYPEMAKYLANQLHRMTRLHSLHIHIKPGVPPTMFSSVPSSLKNLQLYISQVSSDNITWACCLAQQIQISNTSLVKMEPAKYRAIRLPQCELNASQCKTFLQALHDAKVTMDESRGSSRPSGIMVSSYNLDLAKLQHLREVCRGLLGCSFSMHFNERIWKL